MLRCDVVLVSANTDGFRGRRSKYRFPNQGILGLAGALEADGYRVACRDYQTADVEDLMDIENLATFFETEAPVLGVSCRSDMLPLVVAATRRFKAQHPLTTLILGGHGPSEVAAELLELVLELDHAGCHS